MNECPYKYNLCTEQAHDLKSRQMCHSGYDGCLHHQDLNERLKLMLEKNKWDLTRKVLE